VSFLFETNKTPAFHAHAVFLLKGLLKRAGWLVVSSGDGFGGYSSSGDMLATAETGEGGLANNRSWFVMHQPGGRELCFQGNGRWAWRIKYSRTGFVIGTPSTSVGPGAVDERFLLGGGSDEDPVFADWFRAGKDGSYRYNMGAQSVFPYGFWAGGFGFGGQEPRDGVLIMDPLREGTYPAEDPDPFVFYSAIARPLSAESLNGFTAQAHLGSEFLRFPALELATPSGTRLVPGEVAANPYTGKGELFPVVFARPSTDACPGFKGVSSLLRWSGSNRSTGSALSYSGTRDLVVYQHVALPWDGSVPLV
jgi:hypothetical protein